LSILPLFITRFSLSTTCHGALRVNQLDLAVRQVYWDWDCHAGENALPIETFE